MNTRRQFMQWTGTALGGSWLADMEAGAETDRELAPGSGDAAPSRTGSDVGSLFPFIQSQAIRSDFPLSFLREEFTDLQPWKRQARSKLLELLHYAPPRCKPRPQVVETTDQGNHIREKVYFNT